MCRSFPPALHLNTCISLRLVPMQRILPSPLQHTQEMDWVWQPDDGCPDATVWSKWPTTLRVTEFQRYTDEPSANAITPSQLQSRRFVSEVGGWQAYIYTLTFWWRKVIDSYRNKQRFVLFSSYSSHQASLALKMTWLTFLPVPLLRFLSQGQMFLNHISSPWTLQRNPPQLYRYKERQIDID